MYFFFYKIIQSLVSTLVPKSPPLRVLQEVSINASICMQVRLPSLHAKVCNGYGRPWWIEQASESYLFCPFISFWAFCSFYGCCFSERHQHSAAWVRTRNYPELIFPLTHPFLDESALLPKYLSNWYPYPSVFVQTTFTSCLHPSNYL